MRNGLLLLVFTLSGASGLIYEVLWTRRLTHIFGSTTLAVSTVLAAFMGGLALGSVLLGAWADRNRARSLRAYGLLELAIGLFGLFVPALLGALWYGPVYSSAQGLVPPHMRATAASILLFVVNFVGLGLGPLAVGALSDFLASGPLHLGSANGVRWALISSAGLAYISAILFWMARRTLAEEMVS